MKPPQCTCSPVSALVIYVHNTDPIAQYQRSIGIAETHSSVSAYESMYWAMQFTHTRNKTGPFLVSLLFEVPLLNPIPSEARNRRLLLL